MLMRTGLVCLFCSIAVTSSSYSQGTDKTERARTVDDLMQRIRQLSLRVTQLHTQKRTGKEKLDSATPPRETDLQTTGYFGAPESESALAINVPPAEPAEPAADATALAEPVAETDPEQLASAQDPLQVPPPIVVETVPTFPSLKINGFSDFNFGVSDQPGSAQGFREGQFILHFTSALSPKWTAVAETALTATRDASFDPSVERVFIRYTYNDALKLSFGRFHTPVNWWNTAFHHGLWLQTSISRPEMTQFGGEFIPVHFVGAMVDGTIPASGLNFNYNLGMGNGRGPGIRRAGDAGDINNNRAIVGNLSIRPDAFYQLQAGGSIYRDKISLPSGRDFRETLTSAHLVWLSEKPELIAEFANIRHNEIGNDNTFNHQSFYVQAAYRLPWYDGFFKPYYRYELIDINNLDPVFLLTPDLNGSTFGLRMDLAYYVALKAEYRRQGGTDFNGGFMQLSFTF